MYQTIARHSIHMNVYYLTSTKVEKGIRKKQYDMQEIIGVFQPLGEVSKMGKMYNEIDGEWRLFTFSNYDLKPDYIVEVNDNFYKIYEKRDWSQYGLKRGHIEYRLRLATTQDRENVLNFIEEMNSANTCGL